MIESYSNILDQDGERSIPEEMGDSDFASLAESSAVRPKTEVPPGIDEAVSREILAAMPPLTFGQPTPVKLKLASAKPQAKLSLASLAEKAEGEPFACRHWTRCAGTPKRKTTSPMSR